MRRRLFLGGLAAFIAAPAIVARENIMQVKVTRHDETITGLQMLMEAERKRIDAFREVLIRGQVGMIDRFRIVIDPADRSDHAAVAKYERKGGHVLINDVQIIHAEEWLRWV